MSVQRILKRFREEAEDPGRSARDWKSERDGKIIGWLPADVPEELVEAAGALPFGILGSNKNISLADAHLQSWACSLSRSSLELALDGSLDFLDGVIIPHSCDTMRMLAGIWRQSTDMNFVENFLLPRQLDRPSARSYLKGELVRLGRLVSEFTGKEITTGELQQVIKKHNRSRQLLRKLYSLHRDDPSVISCRDLYTAIKAAMIMPKDIFVDLMEQLLEKLDQESANGGDDRLRLVLSGEVWEPPGIMDIIEEAGGTVVADDLHTAYRYIANDPPEDVDPWEALVERQLNRAPTGWFDSAKNPRPDFLVDLAQKTNADGVIFLHLKFCEPENYDYRDLREALDQAGIPNLRVETDFISPAMGQLETRIQAFMEMIEGGADENGNTEI